MISDMIEFKELIKPIMQNPLKYTERALRDIKRTHHNDERLRQILLNPKKVDIYGKNTFIIQGRKTAKMKVEIIEGKYLLVHWFEYNKTLII